MITYGRIMLSIYRTIQAYTSANERRQAQRTGTCNINVPVQCCGSDLKLFFLDPDPIFLRVLDPDLDPTLQTCKTQNPTQIFTLSQ
jgi:hypothetical protein